MRNSVGVMVMFSWIFVQRINDASRQKPPIQKNVEKGNITKGAAENRSGFTDGSLRGILHLDPW